MLKAHSVMTWEVGSRGIYEKSMSTLPRATLILSTRKNVSTVRVARFCGGV